MTPNRVRMGLGAHQGAVVPRDTTLPLVSGLILLLLEAGLRGQETDLVDTGDLAGRGVTFVTEETTYFGVDHVSSVGDVNGDGVSDLGLIHVSTDPVFDLKVYLVFGSPAWTSRNPIAPELSNSVHFNLLDSETTKVGASYIINVGDLNGDGFSEFAFAFDNYRPLGSNGEIRGVVFIIHGRSAFTDSGEVVEAIGAGVPGSTIFSTRPAMSATGFEGTCAVLDINGDQKSDLAIGALLDEGERGIIHVLLQTGDSEARSISRTLGIRFRASRSKLQDCPGRSRMAGTSTGMASRTFSFRTAA
jgi:hypothetical protein